MRRIINVAALLCCVAAGYLIARSQPAAAGTSAVAMVDEHAGHGERAAGGGVVMDQQQAAAIPASSQTVAQRLESSPRHGEWVSIKVGASDSVMAWVVYPERSTRAPVVIAIHENTGLTTWARGVADQLAAEGFIGIAPDMLTMHRSGNLTEELPADQGRALIGRATPEFVNAALDAVAKYGMSLQAAEPRYGVVGFCWGGGRSFLHATHATGLGAAVVYYGPAPAAERLTTIQAPVLGLYGGADARINAGIPATDSAMKRLGKPFEYEIYDGAGHGFLRGQENSEANAGAARQAWPRTVTFLREKLSAR
jgi:carboxymethylenebutenolidase